MESTIIQWVMAHGTDVLAVLWLAEKIVKLSPSKADDIVIDILGGFVRRLLKGRK